MDRQEPRGEMEFYGWLYSLDDEDPRRKLVDAVFSHSDLFADMMFEPHTVSGERAKVIVTDASGKDFCVYDKGVFGEKLDPSAFYEGFYYEVSECEDGAYGFYQHDKRLLCIDPQYLEDESSIVHEMIHMHEEHLNDLPAYYRDMLLWSLYIDLRGKVENLDKIVEMFTNVGNFDIWAKKGGVHSLLFVLKSLDIDLRKGWTLGTTMGYDWADSIKENR